MSYHLRRKSRPQADIEISGGPLKQSKFDGGMNIDAPATEIKSNEVAYAENVIFREYGIEARAGSVRYSTDHFTGITAANVLAYAYNPASYSGTYQNYRHTINYNGTIRSYKDNPGGTGTEYIDSTQCSEFGNNGSLYAAGTGDCTMIPYLRGFLTFTSSKITYTDPGGSFKVNSPNPVHGLKDDHAAASTHVYQYLFTLSRILTYGTDPTSYTISADRLVVGAEVVHETGTNGNRFSTGGTSTARDHAYGEVYTANDISTTNTYTISSESLSSAFGSTSGILDNTAGTHFTHVSVYRTLDIGTLGIDPVTGQGNNSQVYVWVMDVPRNLGAPTSKIDNISDKTLRERIGSKNLILKTQGFTPMPSGSCAELAGGFMFVADRSNATPETRLSYCAVSAAPENIGYYFADVQNERFNDGIRALKANQDILSIFCNSSSHICNLTSITTELSKIQYVPFLNYFHVVDRAIGIRDWGSLDSVNQNTLIAVCSDASVRMWDTTKWGDDLSYGRVKSEIAQIVPASPYTYTRGSVGRYYKGAYYLWYSKDTSDTATTKVLRYGFGRQATYSTSGVMTSSGVQADYGWSFYTGWVYPMFKAGVQVITDNNGVQRLIVMSSVNNGNFYWVETFNAYVGSVDTTEDLGPTSYRLVRKETDLGSNSSSQAGTEIACTVKFREMIAADESNYLVHTETFIKWRPYSVATGYRSGFSVSLVAFKDGSSIPAETVGLQPRTASLKFTTEIAARRIQLAVVVPVGGWRITGLESLFRSLDRINYATSGDVSSSESTISYPQYQAELATNFKHWVTRRVFGLDRANGSILTQTGTITGFTGPDGVANSAYSFSTNSATFSRAASNSYDSDFSITFSAKSPPTNLDVFRIAGAFPMYVQFTNSTTMNFSGLGSITVTAISAGFPIYHIVRSESVVNVYQNTILKATFTAALTLGGGAFTMGFGTGVGAIYDLRIQSYALSTDAINYYYNDVTTNAGKNTLPMI